MKQRGLALIELLVAIAIGLAVMGGALLTLRQAARSLSTEQKVTLSQDQGARVLQGLSGELKGRPAAFLLPGASEQGASLVTLVGNGWPVIPAGYSSQKVRITGGVPDLQVGAPAVLVSPTGEVFYINALASITPIDATTGVYELDFGGNCGNPLSFVQGMRVYKTDILTIVKTPGGLEIGGTSLENQQVIALRDFTLRYVYSSPERETLSPTYQGASLSDGSRLTALAFQATGTTEASRAYTARIPLKSGTVEVRNVVTCGGTSVPPDGTGVVTIVVNPVPPGGGDVTLLASRYTRTTRFSYTFRDVPVGNVTAQAQDVWTDSLTAWAPSPRNQSGILYTFAPLTFTFSYSIVPGSLTFSASGFPADGSATVSAGPYSATLGGGGSQTVSAMPGVYGTSASAEVSVSRSQGSVSWTEIYTLESVSPRPEVSVRSYGSASVTATYSGPLPGTLCYDGNCQQAAPGYYTAPPEEVINTWTRSYTKPCPPNHRGEITVTERWRTVKYWTPREGGLSSRGTLVFRSDTRDERVDYREDPSNCVPLGYLRLNVTLATRLGGDPNPYVKAEGPIEIPKTTWGTSTYEVQTGTYTVSARNIDKRFTSQGLSYRAEYTPSISAASVDIPAGQTRESTVTYTVVNGTFCDYEGCRSVWPGIYSGSGGETGEPQQDSSPTDMGDYWYITRTTSTYRTYVHYFNSPYAVSSGETVNASYTSRSGLIYYRYILEKKYKNPERTETLQDVEYWWRYEYIDYGGGRCWAVTYSRSRNNMTGHDTGPQYPNTCLP